jgi:hypothetical protein
VRILEGKLICVCVVIVVSHPIMTYLPYLIPYLLLDRFTPHSLICGVYDDEGAYRFMCELVIK